MVGDEKADDAREFILDVAAEEVADESEEEEAVEVESKSARGEPEGVKSYNSRGLVLGCCCEAAVSTVLVFDVSSFK